MNQRTKKVSLSYFFIHVLVEIVCFGILFQYFTLANALIGAAALLYDFLAFIPQGIIGDFYHQHPSFNLGWIGVGMMMGGVLLVGLTELSTLGLIFVALGNAALHEAGAIATTKVSEGKLFPSALFVGGGSFGLIIGQTMGIYHMGIYPYVLCVVIIALLYQYSFTEWNDGTQRYPSFQITKPQISNTTIVWVVLLVVTVRSLLGYAIPMSWKKELWQSYLLFFTMGFGKLLGGYFSDRFGARNVGVFSTLLCIPFLIIGDHLMFLSIVGVFLFSLTMSITFGMTLSVYPDTPGVGFGLTTLGLFLGICPLFIWEPFHATINTILIVVLSIGCAIGLHYTCQ